MQHALPRLEFENFVPSIFPKRVRTPQQPCAHRASTEQQLSPMGTLKLKYFRKKCFCETKDVKNDSVQHALPRLEFENFVPGIFPKRVRTPRQLFPPLSSLRAQSMETSSMKRGIGRRTHQKREIVLYKVELHQ